MAMGYARFLTFVLLCIPCQAEDKLKFDDWNYRPGNDDGSLGPEEWSQAYPACGEKGTQSPIDISRYSLTIRSYESFGLTVDEHPEIECGSADYIVNEHTLEVGFGKCQRWSVTLNGKTYKLKQVHFHSASEHTLNGVHYPMEAHYVHAADDGTGLVMAALIGVSENATEGGASSYLSTIWSRMPGEPAPDNFHDDRSAWDLGIPYFEKEQHPDYADTDCGGKTCGYFHYDGSLTTPPCTHGVQWVIAAKPVLVSQAVVDKYRKKINDNDASQLTVPEDRPLFVAAVGPVTWDTAMGVNYRPVQPLTGSDWRTRKLYLFTPMDQGPAILDMTEEEKLSGIMRQSFTIAGLSVLFATVAFCGNRRSSGTEDAPEGYGPLLAVE